MKKRIISIFLAVVMIAALFPLGAVTAFAEEVKTPEQNGWTFKQEVWGEYGIFIRHSYSFGDYYSMPLNSDADFQKALATLPAISGGTQFHIALSKDMTVSSFINDSEISVYLFLNGHTLTVSGDISIKCSYLVINHLGEGSGTISFPNNTKNNVFTGTEFEVVNTTFSNCRGRIFNMQDIDSSCTFDNCAFENCSSNTYGTVAYLNRTDDAESVSFNNCRFTNCTTTEGTWGGAVFINDVADGLQTQFNSCTVENCHADNGYGGFLYAHDIDADVIIRDSKISNCSAKKDGGFAYFDNEAAISISNTVVSNCSARSGGAIYTNGAAAIKDCLITNCTAGENGGAIYTSNPNMDLENSVIYSCTANKYGGGLYIANSSAFINCFGKSEKDQAIEEAPKHDFTVIAGCSAQYGGGAYAADVDLIQNFIFADNQSTYDGGGMYNNTGASAASTVNNCRFYRNKAGNSTDNKVTGGGLCAVDNNGHISNCRFFENEAYKSGAELWSNTYIENCTFTIQSVFKTNDTSAIDVSEPQNCTFQSADKYTLKQENGTYEIKSVDDWDALSYMVKTGKTDSDPRVVLENDITAVNFIGLWASADADKRPFTGTFDGNGHTVKIYLLSGASNNAAFNFTNGATVKNLTVKGRVKGNSGAGGIISHAENTTVQNCVNHADISGSDYVGGIIGWAKGTHISNCTNYGNITGKRNVAGICGKSTSSKYTTCGNHGDITANESAGGICGNTDGTAIFLSGFSSGNIRAKQYAGGIVGFEKDAVTLKSCHTFGTVALTGPAYGDYVLHLASDETSFVCGGNGAYTFGKTAGAEKVFTFTYDSANDCYYIQDKNTGYYLAAAAGGIGSVEQYDFGNGVYLGLRWSFEPDGNGNYYIKSSLFDSYMWFNSENHLWTHSSTLKTAFKLSLHSQSVNSLSSGITGNSASGSVYEACFYDKEKCPENSHGIGLSSDAMNGKSSDIIEEKEYIMPDAANEYVFENAISSDGLAPIYFDENNLPRFAEAFTESTPSLWEADKSAHYYIAEDILFEDRFTVLGDVHLYLINGAVLTAEKGITLQGAVKNNLGEIESSNNTLNIHGSQNPSKAGKLIAAADADSGNAAIGGTIGADSFYNAYPGMGCGTLNLYGGFVSVSGEVGFGGGRGGASTNTIASTNGGNGGNGGELSLYGGSLVAEGTEIAIGGGRGGYGKGKYGAFGGDTRLKCDADTFYVQMGESKDSISEPVSLTNETSFGSAKYVVFYNHHNHHYETVYEWSDDFGTCTAKEICPICSEKAEGHIRKTATVYSTSEHTKATSTKAESFVYTASFDSPFETQTKTITLYDCISAEKGAYIDTGYQPTGNTRVVMPVFINSMCEFWFGVWDNNWSNKVFTLVYTGGEVYAGFGNNGGGYGVDSFIPNGYHTVELDRGTAKIDGKALTPSRGPATFKLSNTLYLFAQNRRGSELGLHNYQGTITCCGCEIYENGTLVKNFVPCTVDGVAGLLDTISGVVYLNQGTSSMIAHNDAVIPFFRKPATCTEYGHAEYFKVNGKYYSDRACQNEITDLENWLATYAEDGGGKLPMLDHTWECISDTQHKCSVCNAKEDHVDDGTGRCSECHWVFCDHEYTEVVCVWNDTYTECTGIKRCIDCGHDLLTETTTAIEVATIPGANCKETNRTTYTATFATLGVSIITVEGEYGPHHYVDYICEYCQDEQLTAAKEDALETLDDITKQTSDVAVALLINSAKDAVRKAETVAEVMQELDYWLSAIGKLLPQSDDENTADHVYIDKDGDHICDICGQEHAIHTPKTGDRANLAVPMILITLSGAAMLLLLLRRKKEKDA